jgi:hypothetical protein
MYNLEAVKLAAAVLLAVPVAWALRRRTRPPGQAWPIRSP